MARTKNMKTAASNTSVDAANTVPADTSNVVVDNTNTTQDVANTETSNTEINEVHSTTIADKIHDFVEEAIEEVEKVAHEAVDFLTQSRNIKDFFK